MSVLFRHFLTDSWKIDIFFQFYRALRPTEILETGFHIRMELLLTGESKNVLF